MKTAIILILILSPVLFLYAVVSAIAEYIGNTMHDTEIEIEEADEMYHELYNPDNRVRPDK